MMSSVVASRCKNDALVVARQVFFLCLSWDMSVRCERLSFLIVIFHNILERCKVDFSCFIVEEGEKDPSETSDACS